jgi:hypothetical protein
VLKPWILFVGLISVAGCGSSAAPPVVKPTATPPSFHTYEAAVLPVLSASVSTFQRAVKIVSKDNDLNNLPNTCEAYRQLFSGLQIQFDSIPRAGPWFTPSGVLHRQAMGVYHRMLGTIDACQLAADTGSRSAAATMKRDMERTTQAMEKLRAQVKGQLRTAKAK